MSKVATITKQKEVDTSQEPFDYSNIQQLKEKARANPQVKKNWEEFYKRERIRKQKEKAEKQKEMDTSQKPFDYQRIQQLNKKAWADPQVQENWKEFYKREKIRKQKEKAEKQKEMDTSQKPFDYGRIQQLNKKAWDDPQVQENWKEFYKREEKRKKEQEVSNQPPQ